MRFRNRLLFCALVLGSLSGCGGSGGVTGSSASGGDTTSTGTAGVGGAGGAGGSAGTGSGGASSTSAGSMSATTGSGVTMMAACQGHIYECGDLIDNDGDGLMDSEDPDCLGPCDNTEKGFYGGIPGQSGPACTVDCYFD